MVNLSLRLFQSTPISRGRSLKALRPRPKPAGEDRCYAYRHVWRDVHHRWTTAGALCSFKPRAAGFAGAALFRMRQRESMSVPLRIVDRLPCFFAVLVRSQYVMRVVP